MILSSNNQNSLFILRLKLLGIEGSESLNLVNAVTQKMTVTDLAACLAKTKLNKEQVKTILLNRQVEESEAEEMAQLIIETQALNAASVATNTFANSTNRLKAALGGLGSVIKAHPIMTAVTVLTSVIAIINLVKQKVDDVAREIAQNAEKAADSAKQLKDSLDGLKDYQTKIDNLVEAINSDSISQADAVEKRKELLTVQEELIKKYGHEEEVVYLGRAVRAHEGPVADEPQVLALAVPVLVEVPVGDWNLHHDVAVSACQH